MNELSKFCHEWNLSINMEKTKCITFQKENRKSGKNNFLINNVEVKNTTEYRYLGMNINAAGSLSPTLVKGCQKGRKAIFALNRRFSIKKLPIEIALKLFDSYINPILLYGLDIWMPLDFNKWDHTEIESVHLQFCKHILGVNRSTSNILVRGELGRYPLKVTIDTRIIQTYKHFFQLKK